MLKELKNRGLKANKRRKSYQSTARNRQDLVYKATEWIILISLNSVTQFHLANAFQNTSEKDDSTHYHKYT